MQRGFTPIIILMGIVLVGVAAGGVYYFQKQQTIKKINSFEQCTKAGYPVMESYPARCRTPDGKSFTQVISDEEKKKLQPPGGQVCIQVITPAKNSKTGECKDFPNPCVVPEGWEKVESCGTGSMDTTNWRTYINTKVGFSIKYPSRYLSKPTFPRGPSVEASYATGDEDNRVLLFEDELSVDNYSFSMAPFKGTAEELFQKSTSRQVNDLSDLLRKYPTSDATVSFIMESSVVGNKALFYERIGKGGPYNQYKETKQLLVYFTAKDHGFILEGSPSSDIKEMELILDSFKILK